MGISTMLLACGTAQHSNNDMNSSQLQRPPQKTTAGDAAMPINTNPTPSATSQAVSQLKSSKNNTSGPRIQETRSAGGNIDQIKVNNINNVPPYYINAKPPVDSNAPSSDGVTAPSWQIKW